MAKSRRPGLDTCLAAFKEGDTLVVWRLDRLGRSMHHLVELIEDLRNRGIGFQSVSDGFIDTTSASGELIFHIFSALAQFERRLILLTAGALSFYHAPAEEHISLAKHLTAETKTEEFIAECSANLNRKSGQPGVQGVTMHALCSAVRTAETLAGSHVACGAIA